MATILLVSDTVPSLELVKSALAGHEVASALDDAQLIDVAHSGQRFDLALVELGRYELAEIARGVSNRVLLLTDASEDVTRRRVEEAGANGYLRKLGPARMREDLQFLLAQRH